MSMSTPSHELSSYVPNAVSGDGLNTMPVGDDKSNTIAPILEQPDLMAHPDGCTLNTKASTTTHSKARP